MAKCSGITQAGEACKGRPIDNSQWCYYHHPEYVEERKRHGARGGKRAGRGRPQAELAGIKTQLQELVDQVLDGSVDRADASVAGQLLNIVLRAVTVELQVQDQLDFQRRLETLEELYEQNKNRGGYYGA
jgi:flagellar biosynthesis/type III secretory pathway protein FliH